MTSLAKIRYQPLVSMYSEVDEKAPTNDFKNSAVDETSSDSVHSDLDHDEVYSLREQRAIIHRIDRRLVTVCGVIYCFALIDRGNLGSAAIAGSVLYSL